MFAQDFYLNPKLSDVSLKLAGHDELIPAHRIILSRCRYFSSLFMSSYSDSASPVVVLGTPLRGGVPVSSGSGPLITNTGPPKLDDGNGEGKSVVEERALTRADLTRALSLIYNVPVTFTSPRDAVDFLLATRFLCLFECEESRYYAIRIEEVVKVLNKPSVEFIQSLNMTEYELVLAVYETAHNMYLPLDGCGTLMRPVAALEDDSEEETPSGGFVRSRVIRRYGHRNRRVGLVPETYLTSLRQSLEAWGYEHLSPRWVSWIVRLICRFGNEWRDAFDLAFRWCNACSKHPGIVKVLEVLPKAKNHSNRCIEAPGDGWRGWGELLAYDIRCPPLMDYVVEQLRWYVLHRGMEHVNLGEGRTVNIPTHGERRCEYEREVGVVCGETHGHEVRCGETRCHLHANVEEESKGGVEGYLRPCRCGRGWISTERVGIEYLCMDCANPLREARTRAMPEVDGNVQAEGGEVSSHHAKHVGSTRVGAPVRSSPHYSSPRVLQPVKASRPSRRRTLGDPKEIAAAIEEDGKDAVVDVSPTYPPHGYDQDRSVDEQEEEISDATTTRSRGGHRRV